MAIELSVFADLLPEELRPQKQVDMSANDSVYATASANPWYAPAGVDRGRVDMVSRCAPAVDVDAELQYFQDKVMTSLTVPETYFSAPLSGQLLVSSGSLGSEWLSPETLSLRAENKELKDKLAQAEAAYYCSQTEVARQRAVLDAWVEGDALAVEAYWVQGVKTIDLHIEVQQDPMTAYDHAMKVL